MKKFILVIFFLVIATSVWADDYGCFEPNAIVQARLSVLSANTISGVTSDLRYPDDTQVSTPVMTQINGNAYKTSYTVAASPTQTGKYFLYYYYTDGNTIYSSANRGPFDSFTIRMAGQCGTTGNQTVLLSNGTGAGQISLTSGAVLLQPTQTGVTIPTVTSVTNGVGLATNAITSTTIQDGAITPAKEYIIAGTVNAVSTTTTIYTALAVLNARTYNNMCLYSASNGERSRILSTGNGYFKVRGFGVAPTNGTGLNIYVDGCL